MPWREKKEKSKWPKMSKEVERTFPLIETRLPRVLCYFSACNQIPDKKEGERWRADLGPRAEGRVTRAAPSYGGRRLITPSGWIREQGKEGAGTKLTPTSLLGGRC